MKVKLAYNDKSTAGLPADAATPAQGDDVVRIEIKERLPSPRWSQCCTRPKR